jgi:hypothetical protein
LSNFNRRRSNGIQPLRMNDSQISLASPQPYWKREKKRDLSVNFVINSATRLEVISCDWDRFLLFLIVNKLLCSLCIQILLNSVSNIFVIDNLAVSFLLSIFCLSYHCLVKSGVLKFCFSYKRVNGKSVKEQQKTGLN